MKTLIKIGKFFKNIIKYNVFTLSDYFISSNKIIRDIIILQERHHKSWDTVREIFTKKVKGMNLQIGAEIGVAFAGNAEYILKNTDVKKLFGIDQYRHQLFYLDSMNLSQRKFNYLYAFVLGKMNRFKERFELIRTSSQEASDKISELDFIYIDGDHSYKGAKKDIEMWYPKIKVGGIIGGDNYGHPSFPGVKLAVQEFFNKEKREIIEKGGVWYVIKK